MSSTVQVSLPLAEGETTREVAAALFLSPKTVEYHLRKVYTKLGIRSRTELAQRLHDPLPNTDPNLATPNVVAAPPHPATDSG